MVELHGSALVCGGQRPAVQCMRVQCMCVSSTAASGGGVVSSVPAPVLDWQGWPKAMWRFTGVPYTHLLILMDGWFVRTALVLLDPRGLGPELHTD